MAKAKTAPNALPAQDLLNRLLRYEPETGNLFWRERTPDMFEDGVHSAEHVCSRWNSRLAGKPALGAKQGQGYRHGNVASQWVLSHRVIWKMVTGDEPDQIDHIDGDRSNNRWENLRDVTAKVNHQNMRPSRNTSGVVGVRWNALRGYWQAFITVDYKFISLGVYRDLRDAVAARKAAEVPYNFHPNHGR